MDGCRVGDFRPRLKKMLAETSSCSCYDFVHRKTPSEFSSASDEHSATSVLDLTLVQQMHRGARVTDDLTPIYSPQAAGAQSALPLDEQVESDREMAEALGKQLTMAHEEQIEADRSLAEAIDATENPVMELALAGQPETVGDGFVIASGGGGGSETLEPAVRASRLSALAEHLAAAGCACTAADMRQLLTSTVELAAAARPRAVRKCVAFVNDLLQSAVDAHLPCVDQPGGDTALCGWPIRSYNEWGTAQDRILVLSYHALWRIDYSDPWSKVDHWSRTPLREVCGLQRRGHGSLRAGNRRSACRAALRGRVPWLALRS